MLSFNGMLILGGSALFICIVETRPYKTYEEKHRIILEFGMPQANLTTATATPVIRNVLLAPDRPSSPAPPMHYRSMPAFLDPASIGKASDGHLRNHPGLVQPATFIHTGEHLNITAERIQEEEEAARHTTESPCGPDVVPEDCIDDEISTTEAPPETTTPYDPLKDSDFVKILVGLTGRELDDDGPEDVWISIPD
ncbi:uncharacterized protein LOC129592691 [Paramacrobiotus metropolitanus]|uniref:uncharacterized protein LOC129592691 n=1 Tax=Paramacrobiotus metropolitanus TaxID=2943436 RepID=UPI0024461E82|nr:uncharacterized protein LOC129592691 [Paramacrobiotus metropolitanus]